MRYLAVFLSALVFAIFATPMISYAQTPGSDRMEVISTSGDDGASRANLITGKGPLLMQGTIGGRWSGTENSQVQVQLTLTNPSNVPIRLDNVRAAFKKGAHAGDPTLYVDQQGDVVIQPGTHQTIWLQYPNPQRLGRVSVDLNVTYHTTGQLNLRHDYMQDNFIAGKDQNDNYYMTNRLFNGITPVPTGIGNYPMVGGPLFPWPSPYDMLVSPTSSPIKIRF